MARTKPDKIQVDIFRNGMKALFSTRVYELEAVMNACYNLIDQYYIYFEPAPAGGDAVSVTVKAKQSATAKQLERTAGELQNMILAETLRLKLSVRNKTLRKRIVEQAISSALSNPQIPDQFPEDEADKELVEMNRELEKILKESETMSYLDDPLNIGVPVRKAGAASAPAKAKTKRAAAKTRAK